MSRGRTKHGAFTLLEMLVATAITAMLAGSLWATLHIAFKARRSATSAVEEVRKVEFALETLRADIQAAVVPVGILAGEFIGQEATNLLGREADTLILHCTAPGSAAAEGRGDIRLVEIACEQAADGTGLVLVRRATANLLAPTAREPDAEVLCRGVYAFTLRYFDGIDWLANWDSTTQDNQLPAAVEVTLQLQDDRQLDTNVGGYVTSQVFVVPCSSIVPGVAMEVGQY